jgi:hypothetical protein
MDVRQGQRYPPPSPAPSGLASVQGLRIRPRQHTEVSYGDETQSK